MPAKACRRFSLAGTPARGGVRPVSFHPSGALARLPEHFIAGSTRFLDGSTVICIESSNRPATHAQHWGKGNRETVRYDSAVLERVAQRFRRDMWDSVVPEAISESGVEVETFGPVQATAFGDLPEVHMLQQIQGA